MCQKCHSGSVIYQEDSQYSAYSNSDSYALIQWKDTKQNQQKERCMGQSLEKTRYKPPCSLSQWSHTAGT